MSRLIALIVAIFAIEAAGCASAGMSVKVGAPPLQLKPLSAGDTPRQVILVGNNWTGIVTIVDAQTYEIVTTIDAAPDRESRRKEIAQEGGLRRFFFFAIRRVAGEGHDQLVDDVFSSPNGRYLFASRPSFGDVVAIDVVTRRIVWRTRVDGFRADHAAITRDGGTLLVSASTAKVVDVIDTATGLIVNTFPSGNEPHENNYSDDGKTIYHASIGRVFLPFRWWVLNWTKGERWFEIIDASNFAVTKRIDMCTKLKEQKRPCLDSAIRPMAITRSGRTAYLQMSFLHGFVKYDLANDKVIEVKQLPVSASFKQRPKFQLNSAHHGIALNDAENMLCIAGTVSGYAAIFNLETDETKTFEVGAKPYWATASADGKNCYMSISERDQLAVISFEEKPTIRTINVGPRPEPPKPIAHPQRVRNGTLCMTAGCPGVAVP